MNATQGKAVLSILNDALDKLQWSGHPMAKDEVERLRARLAEATKPVERGKCVLCDGAMNPADSVEGFIGRKLKPGLAHETCAREYRDAAAEFKAWCQTHGRDIKPAFDAEKMSLCACGHSADSHERDHLDNLLDCKAWTDAKGEMGDEPCQCDHFHYEVSPEQEAA